ncbi:MAG: DNA-directed RNA polymerase subunit omega [Clostridia bacterium]|nr:DNA-directed RNA polymerase subunit omega [Clostridia bacterium]
MIIKPSMTSLLNKVPSKYSLVVGTAKRARQIAQGSPKLTSVKVESDVTTAAIEIDEGKVTVSK